MWYIKTGRLTLSQPTVFGKRTKRTFWRDRGFQRRASKL